jgi:hypothetical protein
MLKLEGAMNVANPEVWSRGLILNKYEVAKMPGLGAFI